MKPSMLGRLSQTLRLWSKRDTIYNRKASGKSELSGCFLIIEPKLLFLVQRKQLFSLKFSDFCLKCSDFCLKFLKCNSYTLLEI